MQVYFENIKIAIQAIKYNLLRSILTILIIAIGIMALVGILTAIESIKGSISENFTSMGANTFTIKNYGMHIRIGKDGEKPKNYPPIKYRDAENFKEQYNFPSKVSISSWVVGAATIKYKNYKSDPNINVWGTDENYLFTSGYELTEGRNFSLDEISFGRNVIIIGKEVKNKVFPNTTAVGKIITGGNRKFKVIGVLKEKGSAMGFGGDKTVLIPITYARQFFSSTSQSYTISVMCNNVEELNPAIGAAIAKFRSVRKLKPIQEDNFIIVKSDNLANILIENIRYVTLAATLIGIITLVGAAIGLMNIMLVSVTERTKEIGTRKAIGATPQLIRNQFLTEAILVCQLGGLVGIILGVLVGNLTSFFIGGIFVIPWIWIFSGISLCIIVGIVAGIFPALQAAKLDPIEALRYE
jgi:putative ABC transport system permease protein